jgi:ubiquinone biosynthesis protein Coq4
MESSDYPFVQRFFRFFNNLEQLTANLGLDVPKIIDLDALVNFPKGTLGCNLLNFYLRNNLEPFDCGSRRKQLHDSIHVLTGYETDLLSEAEVQAFLWGCDYRPFHLILSLRIVSIISSRQVYPNSVVRDRLWKAYKRGQNSNFHFDYWQPETQWHLPLKEIQKRYCM